MKYLMTILCWLPFVAVADEATCISYAPNTVLAGKLERHTFPGRPNYESIAKGDEAETGFYLRLARPICTKGDSTSAVAYPQNKVKLVQLVLNPKQYDELRRLLGKAISVKGDLFARHTGHHHAPLLLTVIAHEELPRH